jgi:single-stranded-DNA-specific exonuclease
VDGFESHFDDHAGLAQWLQCSTLVAQILWQRGLRNKEQITAFLKPGLSQLPHPFTIIDMEKAVDRLVDAVANEEPIAVYGDYDVDGTCGAAILTEFLRSLGVDVRCYQPNRFKEGYGVNVPAVERLISEGATVLISVDCGITAVAPAAVCVASGVDYVVLDHHLPGDVLPQAFALVDPQRAEDTSGLQNLCGAGLAFFFVMGLRLKLRQAGFFDGKAEPNLLSLLDLVAVATIADMADVRGVNRILVSHGLKVMKQKPRPGLKAIFDLAGVKDPRSQHLGFVVGPRINAAGRLETATPALELLLTTDQGRAQEIAEQLEQINRARRESQDEVVAAARAQALEQVSSSLFQQMARALPAAAYGPWPRALVLAGENWHEGVVGIVASKIMEEFKRPVFVLTRKGDLYKGSARSLAKVDIFNVMQSPAVSQFLTNYGGHAYAGGASLKVQDLDAFRAGLNEYLALTTVADDYIVPRRADAELSGADMNLPLLTRVMAELDQLEPFGLGFPEPVFRISGVAPSQGRVLKDKHLKFRIGSVDALWFGAIRAAEETETVLQSLTEDAVYWVSPQWNEWQGVRKLQFRVSHGELSGSEAI